ncbi:protein containing DUF1499 [Pseudovibrio sp. FO-BEG1]|nr:protein containing DUF1499 [Pseudovibrio sp. FO-BEG1]
MQVGNLETIMFKGLSKMAVIAILLVALVVGVTVKLIWQNSKVPEYVGVHDGQFAPLPNSPNAVSSQAQDASRHVEPLPMLATFGATQAALTNTLEEMGKNKISKVDGPYLHAVFTSAQMGYNDDVELWIDEQDRVVHYRSQSRVGYSDMGANRARYDRFRSIYSTFAEGEN